MEQFSQVRRATAWTQPAAEQLESIHTGTGSEDRPRFTEAEDDECGAGLMTLEPGRLYRRVSGVDRRARLSSEEELTGPADPMAAVFFRRGRFPRTTQELLSGLPQAAIASQQVYLVSEAGQIPPASAPGLYRDMRFVITSSVQGREVDLLISTGADDTSTETFLQVAAWDPRAKVFNFYMRSGSAWVWAGNSWDALAPGSRGRGCFDSHVNGSVVMKELKLPWINWQSQKATIQLADDDPLRTNPLYRRVIGAERLELTVKSLMNRWTGARLAEATGNSTIEHPDRLLRHLFTTTTVNLASTDRQSSTVTSGSSADLILPMGFWMNADALVDGLGLELEAGVPTARADLYVQSLSRYAFRLEERTSGFSLAGDTFFAFVVPEAAYEDNDVVNQMIRCGLISAKFAACALMTDFSNPVLSPARAGLMRYVPTTPTEAATLCDRIVRAILGAAAHLPADSPEGRFAADWKVPDSTWQTVFGQRVDAYLRKAGVRSRTESGFDDYTRLAESRRRQFRTMKLNEFALTLPVTDIPADAPLLRMREDATVAPQN